MTTCQDLQDRLHDWIDGELGAEPAEAARAHTAICEECRAHEAEIRALVAALADLPAPELSTERAQRLLERARPGRPVWPVAAAAAAAGIALALLVLPPAGPQREHPLGVERAEAAPAAELALALREPRTVRLSLTAEQTLEDVTVVLELPPGVRLHERPDQRVLRWQTTLQEGANRLSLPLVADEPGVRDLVARIEHGGRAREVRLRLHASAPDAAPPERGASRAIPGRRLAA